MKAKTLLPLIFLFNSVFAQKGNTTMNFMIGHNFSEFKTHEDNQPKFKNLTMFAFDFLHRWSFKSKNFIESGIRVQNFGNRLTYSIANSSYSIINRVTTFACPITFNYKLEKYNLILNAGVSVGYMSSAKFTNTDSFHITETEYNPGIKYFATGGIKWIPKWKNERIGFIINYNYGMNSFIETRTFNRSNGFVNLDINKCSNLSVGFSYFY